MRKLKRNDYVLIIVFVLFISFLFNIYTVISNKKYKYAIGNISYDAMEDFRNRNKSNIEIMSNSLDVGSIDNKELLDLYKNYYFMSKDIIQLWEQYDFYNKNTNSILQIIRLEDKNVIESDISAKLEEYTLYLVNKQMGADTGKLSLKGKYRENFKYMWAVGVEIDNYFEEFNEKELKGSSDDYRKDLIINDYNWIRMLEGINELSAKFINYDFN